MFFPGIVCFEGMLSLQVMDDSQLYQTHLEG